MMRVMEPQGGFATYGSNGSITMDRIDQTAKDKVQTLIKDIRIAMLATRSGDGKFHARPMATSDMEFDGTLWFLTDNRSGKIDDIEADGEVLVTYADETHQTYVSVTGQGKIIRDPVKIRDLWSEPARVWFPKGPDDPNIAVIRIDVETAEYWDSPSATMVMLYGYAKAWLTGRQPDELGEHERVRFQH